MSEVTRILSAIGEGDPRAADRLLPLVYDELRVLAAQRLAREMPGQTLQPTALVHEAYLRLVDTTQIQQWNSRGHFFGAAAEAMRRILIDNARRKQSEKHGGVRKRVDLTSAEPVADAGFEDLLELNDALAQLAQEDASAADLAKLRLFTGLSVEEAADALGVSRATAYRDWSYARAWLHARLRDVPTTTES
jgi:RNA polymerase sigma factor (TIGR02999 family)